MKSLKRWNYIIIIFLSVITISIQSCSKDDDAVAPQENTDVNADNDADGSTGGDTGGDTSGDNDSGNEDEELKMITLYKVDGEKIIKEKDYDVTGRALEFQKDTKKHEEIWELVKKIVPLVYRLKMNEFVIYSAQESGVAGYVVERTKDLSQWQMGIAIDYAYYGGFNVDGELAYTIVHEFGHIITLDKVQVDSSVEPADCKTYFTGEGCSRESSNINNIYQNHWADVWPEFEEIKDEKGRQKFYNSYKERFVTQYASTNPGEDIAEVFATFVTRASGVNGDSGAEKKIQIMYNDSEMVKLRDYIRGNIAKSSRSFLPAPGSWKNANTFGNKKKSHCSLRKH
ncbi:zinc-binding metallopeptidase [Aquimarina sediminis]|uniref:putative zinc-binding metallopeptidase n=1 Tax=Aquimarina sediminis TaxID=2070536 RepID=UPI000CA04EC9|nr:putative zinc-binding metallopeptidase [Aquimarina sediminis]